MPKILTEPIAIQDVFASGLADAEDMGDGNIRFTFYARQKSFLDYAHETEFIIVARIILPFPAVTGALQRAMKAVGFECCGAGRRHQLMMVN